MQSTAEDGGSNKQRRRIGRNVEKPKETKYTTRSSKIPLEEMSLESTRPTTKTKSSSTKPAIKHTACASDKALPDGKKDKGHMDSSQKSNSDKNVKYFLKDRTIKSPTTVSVKKTVRRFVQKPVQLKSKQTKKRKRRPDWEEEEIYNLIQSSIERSEETKPYFKGEYGTNDIRNTAWEYVARKYIFLLLPSNSKIMLSFSLCYVKLEFNKKH